MLPEPLWWSVRSMVAEGLGHDKQYRLARADGGRHANGTFRRSSASRSVAPATWDRFIRPIRRRR
jgi:hypothetical protein